MNSIIASKSKHYLIKFLFLVSCFLVSGLVFAVNPDESIKQVRLQLLWKHQFEFAGFYAAKAKGFYSEAGMDVDIIPFTPGEESPVEKVVSGNVEFAVGDPSIIIDRAQHKPIKLLANIFQHNPLVLVTLASSGIHSPAQMVGKKIMLAKHEESNVAIEAMLDSESVRLDQMQVIGHTFSVDSLINGDVDIMSAYASNEPGVLKLKGIKFNIIDPINYGIDFYGNNIYTNESYLANNHSTTDAFVKASLKGWRYALDNPQEIIDLILAKYSQEKSRAALEFEAHAVSQLILPDHIPLGNINRNRLQRIIDVYQSLNIISSSFQLDELLPKVKNKIKNTVQLTSQEERWIQQNPVIAIGVDPSWAPFEYLDKQGNYSGMASDFMNIIAERTGLMIKVQTNKTWQDVINSAKAKHLDVLPAVMSSPERKEYLDFTTPHMSYPMVILTSKSSDFISHIDDLNNKKVMVVSGYVTEDILRRNHPDIMLVKAKNINDAIDRVSSGDADAFIDNLASITHNISSRGISNLRISGTTPYEFSLGLGVVKNNPILFSILQKAINSIEEQERKDIRNKWIQITLPESLDVKLIIQVSLVATLFLIMMIFWNRKLSKEVKRRKEFEHELILNEKKFRELFENNKAVELIIDPVSKKIIAANNAAIEFYGYPRSVMLNLTVSDINTLSETEIKEEMDLAVQEKRSHFFFKHKIANGEILDVEVHSGPIEWNNQTLLYSIIHDVTRRTRAEKALVEAKAEAERANRIKGEFLANMSHEIRTPMNSVLGMAELLQETPLNKEQKEMLSIVESSGETLLSIINDILDFSKLEASKMTAEKISFQLLPIIDSIIYTFQSSATEKKLKLLTNISNEADVNIISDPTKLSQILINLVGNAIKFTNAGGSVTICVKLKATGSSFGILSLQVIDSGIGIKAEAIEHLFDSFTQAEQTTTRKFGGTGLGLAISQKLAHLLGGKIQVSSIQGQGSTFEVQIPLEFKPVTQQDKLKRKKPDQVRTQHKPQFKAHILIVEDVTPNQILIKKMLSKFGLNLSFAENGLIAVDMAKTSHFDMIFMDCQMPVMDGYTATQKIREFDSTIPILALTANTSSEDSQKAIASGMNEVIIKPIQLSTLEKVLYRWLGQAKDKQADSTQPDTSTLKNKLSIINYDTLKNLQWEMEEAFEEVYQTIFTSFNSTLEKLQQKHNDNETVIRLYHSLKSQSATLGAEQLADIAEMYEAKSRKGEVDNLETSVEEIKAYITAVKNELQDFKVHE